MTAPADITNKQRTGWARHALTQYATAKEGGPDMYDDPETVLVDLLSDLLHYAGCETINFASCVSTAEIHYQAERRAEANPWGFECPECKAPDEIDICAAVWVRVSQDGTDVTAAANGDHEWNDDSRAVCGACGHAGSVKTFTPGGSE